MESDKHYFIEGLFVIGLALAAAAFFVWLAGSGHRDDVLYRIHFADSVSGLALGDPVKYHGVDVGAVEGLKIDPADARQVQVDVKLNKQAPVKTDTRASLKLKGITGVVYVELSGGDPQAKTLVSATPAGQVPEIPSDTTTSLSSILEQLPRVIDKFASVEDRAHKVLGDIGGVAKKGEKVLNDVGDVTEKIKENPSLLLRRPKDKGKPPPTPNP
jgi:phospholipid/cholesterol/gamma-HCH transport system substrate-binding protein